MLSKVISLPCTGEPAWRAPWLGYLPYCYSRWPTQNAKTVPSSCHKPPYRLGWGRDGLAFPSFHQAGIVERCAHPQWGAGVQVNPSWPSLGQHTTCQVPLDPDLSRPMAPSFTVCQSPHHTGSSQGLQISKLFVLPSTGSALLCIHPPPL